MCMPLGPRRGGGCPRNPKKEQPSKVESEQTSSKKETTKKKL